MLAPSCLQLPFLLAGISTRPQQHQDMLLRMAAQCWEYMATTPGSSVGRSSEQEFATTYSFLRPTASNTDAEPGAAVDVAAPNGASSNGSSSSSSSSATADPDRKLLLRFALMLMLYQPSTARGPANPLAAAQASAARSAAGPQAMDVDAAAAAAVAGLSAGMSRRDVAAVEGKAPPAGGMWCCG
jgi:hypothetical protein